MKARFFFFSVFAVLITGLVMGCGWKTPLDTVEMTISGPTSLTITNEPALGTYSVSVFSGELAEDRGDKFSTNPMGKYWWYLLRGNEIISTEVDGSTHTFKFHVAGSYQITVSVGAALKTNGAVNGIIPTMQFYDVNVIKGQGYKETTISPRFEIREWYPGYITVNGARTSVEPKADKVVEYEWYIDGINFGSGVEAGTSVTECKHTIRLEVKTLYGFSQYLEVDYTYKSGVPSVQINGPSGGVSGGTSGVINQPVDNPVDNNSLPQGNRNIIFSFPVETVSRISTNNFYEPVFIEGYATHVHVVIAYFDKTVVKYLSISGFNGWKVDSGSINQTGEGLSFSATNDAPNAGKVEAFQINLQPLKVGIAGITWPANMVGCSGDYVGESAIIQSGNSYTDPPRIRITG